jgi:hypothetical protein
MIIRRTHFSKALHMLALTAVTINYGKANDTTDITLNRDNLFSFVFQMKSVDLVELRDFL